LEALIAADGRDLSRRGHQLLQRWQALGPVPRDEQPALMKRYRQVLKSLNRARKDHRQRLAAEEGGNLVAKQALCKELEQLAERVSLWQAGKLPGRREEEWLRQLRDLEHRWHDLGPVPRAEMQIEEHGRTLRDRIHAAFTDYLAKQRAAEAVNLEQKQAILVEFEEYMAEEHPRWFKEQIAGLRDRWRKIGPVPRRDFRRINERWDGLWKRFKRL
jgi:hypothetical protein